jgi:hypothetical protein
VIGKEAILKLVDKEALVMALLKTVATIVAALTIINLILWEDPASCASDIACAILGAVAYFLFLLEEV